MANKFTVLGNLFMDKNQYYFITLPELKEIIECPYGYVRDKTQYIRYLNGKPDLQKGEKKKLPVALINGIFGYRNNQGLKDYSCYACLDLDYNLPEENDKVRDDWNRIILDPCVRMAFHSPRGGIKVIFQHNLTDPTYHKELIDDLNKHLGISSFDPSCSDLARATFISYDPGVYFNPSSQVYQFTPPSGKPINPYTPKPVKNYKTNIQFQNKFTTHPPTLTTEKAIQEIQKKSDQYFPVCVGMRNSNTFIFACKLRDYGVAQDEAEKYLILRYVQDGFDGNEIADIVANAYK